MRLATRTHYLCGPCLPVSDGRAVPLICRDLPRDPVLRPKGGVRRQDNVAGEFVVSSSHRSLTFNEGTLTTKAGIGQTSENKQSRFTLVLRSMRSGHAGVPFMLLQHR